MCFFWLSGVGARFPVSSVGFFCEAISVDGQLGNILQVYS